MRIYTVVIIQLMIWSGFTFVEWLSKNDWFVYKIIMFLVFFYLAIIIGDYIIESSRKTVAVTIFSLSIYSLFHILFMALFHNVGSI